MIPERPVFRPPIAARALLWLLLPALHREQFFGDLQEEFGEHATQDRASARRWYWREVLRSRPLALRRQLAAGPSSGSPQPNGRKASLMDTLFSDLKQGVRTLVRNPGFAAVAVLTLTIGIGANTAVFSLVNGVLLRNLPTSDPHELLAVFMSDSSSGPYGTASWLDYTAIRNRSSSLEDIAAFSDFAPVILSAGDETQRLNSALVTGNYFSVLGFDPHAGAFFDSRNDEVSGADPVTVLSYELWQTGFGGDANVVGREVIVNGHRLTVVGSAPAGFRGTHLQSSPALWIPISMIEQAMPFRAGRDMLSRRGTRWLRMIGRMQNDATLEQTQAELSAIATQLGAEFPRFNMGTLQAPDTARPITAMLARHAFVGARGRSQAELVARLLLVVVGFVLLIVCANVANLLLSRGSDRRQEIAVRRAMGASRARLLRQLLTESLVIAAVGGAAGLALAAGLRNVMLAFDFSGAFGIGLTVNELALDRNVLLFSAAVSGATGILFGIAPALRASRHDLVPALKEADRGAGGALPRFGVRNLLVVAQVALSLILLVGAGLSIRSLQNALETDLGFDSGNVLLTNIDLFLQGYELAQGQNFYTELLEGVRSLPGVTSASLAAVVPVNPSGSRTTVSVEGYLPREGEDMELNFNVVADGFFDTMRIDLARGRTFEPHDATGERVVIVNETLVEHFWPGRDPIGRGIQFSRQDSPDRVVGVVRDGKYRSIREAPMPYMYVPLGRNFEPTMTLLVRGEENPLSQLPAVRSQIALLDPNLALFAPRTLDQQISDVLVGERTAAIMLVALGGIALLLAAVGIYGVISRSVQGRTHEIGIRMAIGADRVAVLGMIMRQGFGMIAAGILLGVAGAFMLNWAAASILFNVNATDPLTFGVVAVLLGGVALLACFIPVRRATRIDPIVALRYE